MKVLLIGGTGLISTAITRQLLQRGDEVTHFNRGRSEARYGTGDAGDGEVRRLQGDRKDFPALRGPTAGGGALRLRDRHGLLHPGGGGEPAAGGAGADRAAALLQHGGRLRQAGPGLPYPGGRPPGGRQRVRQGQGPLRGPAHGGPRPGGGAGDGAAPGPDVRRGAGHDPHLRPGHGGLRPPAPGDAGDRARGRVELLGGLPHRRRGPGLPGGDGEPGGLGQGLQPHRRGVADLGPLHRAGGRSDGGPSATDRAHPHRPPGPPRPPAGQNPGARTSASPTSSTPRRPAPTWASATPSPSWRACGAPWPGWTPGA